MSGQGVRWTAEQVLALAPDTASRKSGSKLAAPGPWSEAGTADGALWGLCKGSGKTPYRTVVDVDGGNGPGYTCSCPSRKFPCKHALGLLLLWAGGEESVGPAPEVPQWAQEWLAGRRQRARQAAGAGDAGGGAGGAGQPADPEAARRRAERRARLVSAGAAELEQRLTDLLRGGLAAAEHQGYAAWDEMAARMVDAQAKGLADGLRELGAIPSSGPGWPERLLSESALLHLLAQGVLGLEQPEGSSSGGTAPERSQPGTPPSGSRLPEPLAATVRSRVGLTVDTARLLADEEARVRDDWLVLAQRDTDEGKLTVRRIWLSGRRSRRPALLLSFAVAGRAPQLSLPVGSVLDCDLAFYPGTAPLRAALGERHGPPGAGFLPAAAGAAGGGSSVAAALAAYAAALCEDPWLDAWPVVLTDVVPIPGGQGAWQLADSEGEGALPLAPDSPPAGLWKLTALSGGAALTVFGDCGHRGFTPYTAWSPTADHPEAIPL
ncbi:SWIM zinc finger domain-containing protein [Streptomyces sp. N2-109]|uniref:SWIM zinc finger domain-containing protein n=1 Tax=Streptomyces gossypii TaxID=2883101 RepID=A0ABT2JWT5_9ACTN|nr:SWIM zinc finger family protein [Streptomyces gossypii]MCT2592340.1 SWIM zinc finger domain-containing protein [Streptomyces gossypii]